MKKIVSKQASRINLKALALTLLVLLLSSTNNVSAQNPWTDIIGCKGIIRVVDPSDPPKPPTFFFPGKTVVVDDVASLKGLECVFAGAISSILFLAGIILFIMFIVGGFKYMVAGGDPKAIDAAKKTLTHTIGGLVVLVLAFIILKFVQAITGVDVTQFRVFKFF